MPGRFVHACVLVSNAYWLPENLGLREAKKPRKRAGVRKSEEEGSDKKQRRKQGRGVESKEETARLAGAWSFNRRFGSRGWRLELKAKIKNPTDHH